MLLQRKERGNDKLNVNVTVFFIIIESQNNYLTKLNFPWAKGTTCARNSYLGRRLDIYNQGRRQCSKLQTSRTSSKEKSSSSLSILGSSLVDSFRPALGLALAAADASLAPSPGAATPLGREFPFLLTNPSVGVLSALFSPTLFMLLIRSLTELFRDAAALLAVAAGTSPGLADLPSRLGPSVELSPEVAPPTVVISPDFRSTPTMDQGRGLGSGLGLAVVGVTPAPLSLGLTPSLFEASGDEEEFPVKDEENLEALNPTIDPPPPAPPLPGFTVDESLVSNLLHDLSSMPLDKFLQAAPEDAKLDVAVPDEVAVAEVANSFVGDFKFPASPVDLDNHISKRKGKEMKERTRG